MTADEARKRARNQALDVQMALLALLEKRDRSWIHRLLIRGVLHNELLDLAEAVDQFATFADQLTARELEDRNGSGQATMLRQRDERGRFVASGSE